MTRPSFAQFSQSPECQGFSVDFRLHGSEFAIGSRLNIPFDIVPEPLRQQVRDFVQAYVALDEALNPYMTSSPPDQGGGDEGGVIVLLGLRDLLGALRATHRTPTPTGDAPLVGMRFWVIPDPAQPP